MKRPSPIFKVLVFGILILSGAIGFQGCKENSTNIPLSSIGSTSDVSGVTFATLGKLTGTVVSDSSTGIPNITVVLKVASGGTQLSSTLTTGEGKFFFEKPTSGLYLLEVAVGSPDYISQTYPVQIFSDGSMSPETILVTLKKVSSPVYPKIQGTVVLNTSNEPLANISVILQKEDGTIVARTQTTGSGEFFFSDNISSLLYTLVIASGSQGGFRETLYTVRVLSDGSVSPSEIKIPLSRVPPGTSGSRVYTASGTIYDAFSGAPLEYVTCLLKNQGNILTDFNGRFTFKDLIPNAVYDLELSKDGFSKMTVNFSIDQDGNFFPTVLDYYMIFTQEAGLGAIAGRCYDAINATYTGGLNVIVYSIELRTQTITTASGTVFTDSQFAFESVTSLPIVKSTLTSVGSDAGIGQQFLGGYKVTHLAPTTETKKYVVYIGPGSLIPTLLTRTQRIKDEAVTFSWWVPSDIGSVQVWPNVSVSSNTTTWLSNYDPPRD